MLRTLCRGSNQVECCHDLPYAFDARLTNSSGDEAEGEDSPAAAGGSLLPTAASGHPSEENRQTQLSCGFVSSGELVPQQQRAVRSRTKHWVFAATLLLFVAIFFIAVMFPRAACACTGAPNVPLVIVLIVDGALVQTILAAFRQHLFIPMHQEN